jgi:hypothetical protein
MTMTKPPAKSWEYIPNLEDEKEYVVGFELYNLRAMINNINNNPLAESPVYKQVIIPHLQQLIDKLAMLEEKINQELDIDGYKTIDELVNG